MSDNKQIYLLQFFCVAAGMLTVPVLLPLGKMFSLYCESVKQKMKKDSEEKGGNAC